MKIIQFFVVRNLTM